MEWELLAGVPAEDARRVLAIGRRRTFGRGEIVFHQLDPADSLHLVAGGRFAVRRTTPLGEDALLIRMAAVSGEALVHRIRAQLSFLPRLLGDDPWARRN